MTTDHVWHAVPYSEWNLFCERTAARGEVIVSFTATKYVLSNGEMFATEFMVLTREQAI